MRSKIAVISLVVSMLMLLTPSSISAFSFSQSCACTWPIPEWHVSTPDEQLMNEDILEEMLEYFEENSISINSVIITRYGQIVLEQYYDFFDENTSMNIFSCTKTITSSLIGIAIDQGFIESTNARVLDFFQDREIDNMNQWKEELTIYDLLTMQAGFEWNDNSAAGNSNYNQMLRTEDWVQYVLDQPITIAPGTVFNYNSGASLLLSAIVQNATGVTAEEFAEEYLMGPLGISQFHWRESPQGITIGGNTAMLRPRDMARLGYLYLMNGTWDGEIIVSSDWIANASRTHATVGGGTGYGYQIWTRDSIGSFSARGYAGQYIFVVPEYSLVVVFTATSGWPNTALEEWIIPSIVNYGISTNTETSEWTPESLIVVTGLFIAIPAVMISIVYYKRRTSVP
ncbi:MAG: serine hydrolase domain-containing protein [Candidatus Thorarchaeota archaeon]|jgi:CubicO group peptidase (beta-lactamase class C family)